MLKVLIHFRRTTLINMQYQNLCYAPIIAFAPRLDVQNAVFGKVVSCMKVVDKIASILTNYGNRPKIAVRIKATTLWYKRSFKNSELKPLLQVRDYFTLTAQKISAD